MKQQVLRIFLVALAYGLYLGMPGAGALPRVEAAIASLDRIHAQEATDDESGSGDSGGDEGEGSSEEDSD
jgi:hypothetical protein